MLSEYGADPATLEQGMEAAHTVAVLTHDALGVLEGVNVTHYHEYT